MSFGAISTLILEMGNYDKKLGTITATYSIQEGRLNYSDIIVLHIEEKEKDQAVRLLGFPEGFLEANRGHSFASNETCEDLADLDATVQV